MIILEKPVTRAELIELAENFYGDMVKGVVDVDKELLALDAELHSDLEGLLLGEGSQQEALWGINLYPEAEDEDFLEFDTLINIRPRQGNRSRYVENEEIPSAFRVRWSFQTSPSPIKRERRSFRMSASTCRMERFSVSWDIREPERVPLPIC